MDKTRWNSTHTHTLARVRCLHLQGSQTGEIDVLWPAVKFQVLRIAEALSRLSNTAAE